MKCDRCGVDESEDETVKRTYCPYAKEIHDEVVECTLCQECFHQRWMDT
nr:hypothetical protein [Ningiella ruwaisensis]